MKILLITLFLQTFSTATFAEIKTYTYTVKQPFGGSQSPDDARIGAIVKAKREVLELAGTYLESLTVVRDSMLEKDEILALAAGILKAEIMSQKNYATQDSFGIIVVARVDVDTSILEHRVKKLLRDRNLLEKYRESQLREKKLLAKIEELEKQNKLLLLQKPHVKEKQKELLKKQFKKVTEALTAVQWNQKALGLWRERKFTDSNQALMFLNQAIRLDPNFADAYHNRGSAYLDLDQYDRAIDDYNQAIRLDPNSAPSYNNRGHWYYKKVQFERALEDYNLAIRLDPNLVFAYNNRGVAYANLGQHKQAIEDYDQAIRLDPKYTLAYKNREIALKKQKPCFIATVAFGTSTAPHLETLRKFRDRFLVNNSVGTMLAEIYYTCSPPIADFIARHETLRTVVRWSMLPIVGVSWMAITFGPLSALVIIVLLFTLLGATGVVCFRILRLKRRPG